MTLGDRIAVLRRGELQQVGTPRELYEQPRNLFVAGFIGSPAMNFLPAELHEEGRLELPMAHFTLPREKRELLKDDRRTFIAGIRPEDLQDAAGSDDAGEQALEFGVTADMVEWLGAELYVHFEAEGVTLEALESLPEDIEVDAGSEGRLRLVARVDNASDATEGGELKLRLDTRKLHLFDPDSGECLF
jgi:multiple sugar transport system ATP-binding protein